MADFSCVRTLLLSGGGPTGLLNRSVGRFLIPILQLSAPLPIRHMLILYYEARRDMAYSQGCNPRMRLARLCLFEPRLPCRTQPQSGSL